MTYSLFDLLKLLGALGLFLYGMKIMSEGLQKVAGNKLRSILTAMTKNRVMGAFTGFLITGIIQSSTATTVMAVSFVNAGLLSLIQSVSVIMGANIGTTLTAWLISFLGFKVSVAVFALPLMAIAIPFIFSSKNKRKSIGEFIMGFAFLFMGLELLKNSVPDLQTNPGILEFLSQYTDLGFGSVLIFLGIGTLLTVVVQSSSATMAITLIMCVKGWIPFELGAAMVLGENIGTTLTANIAAIPANISAKRAAFSHLTFNIFGVIWMMIVFYPFTTMVANLVEQFGPGDPTLLTSFSNEIANNYGNETLALISNPDATGLTSEQAGLKIQLEKFQVATSFGLSLFHTLFNLINTFVMIWFVNSIARVVSWVIPQKATDEEFHLKHISAGMLSTSEISLLQARREMYVYAQRTGRMFGLVKDLYDENDENEFVKKYSRIEKYENISDRMEVEIASYLTQVAEGRLSDEGKIQLQSMLRSVSEIESVGDSCYNLARTIKRRNENRVTFTPELNIQVEQMEQLVEKAINRMIDVLEIQTPEKLDTSETINIENEINILRNTLKANNIEDINSKKYDYSVGVIYMDYISECEKAGDYIINVVEAWCHSKE